MIQSTTSQPANTEAATSKALDFLSTPNAWVFLGCGAMLLLLSGVRKGDKRKTAMGHFGSGTEKRAAYRQAKKQILDRKHNSVALYVGSPSLLGKDPLMFPDAQRGMAVCGGPGSGKTFSVIDPSIRSAIEQGFPVILYDFKYPTQTSRVAAYAKENGYKVRVFAPGHPESDTCNPLDFLKDETDSLMARQMAEVLNKNFSTGSADKSEDPFFTQAGDQLTEAIFLLAKSIKEYPDIMMCQALLSVDDLPGRLSANSDSLNPWVYSSFGQLLSVADSEKTVASIIATTNSNFTRFMKKDLLGAFCGETNIPLDLEGKQLLVFGMDRERRDVVGPLLATILHMIVTRNVVRKRKTPLILALDELPTLYLPALVQWLNENREDGLVCMLGFQNMAQLEKTYGKELSRSILGGCATKAIFNPQEYESAQMFSDFLGEEHVFFKQKSRGYNEGRVSSNLSDQEKTRKLFEPSRFLKLPTGQCVLLNPGYRNKKEAGVPFVQRVKLDRAILKSIGNSQSQWKRVKNELAASRGDRYLPSSDDLKARYALVEARFPKQQPESTQDNKKLKLDAFLKSVREKAAASQSPQPTLTDNHSAGLQNPDES